MAAIILSTLIATTLTSAISPVSATTYNIINSHAGSTFFDGFSYFGGYDNTTNGDVFWVTNSSLSYVDANGRAIIKVDNTTTVPYNEKRNSVKLKSNDWYKPGTVMVMDATHLPYGCSVWPAWWTQGPNWYQGGEIDIIETINLQVENQYALHTIPGCTPTVNTTLGTPLGTYGTKTCDQTQNFGSGCIVMDQNPASAGAAFAAAGGGVYIMAFEETGITIWFYSRPSVPAALTAGAQTIDTASLGTPTASYSSSTCNIAEFFGSQQMILDITLCGDWAGQTPLLLETCGQMAAGQTCYTTYVLNSTNYNEAYFEINYINVFGTSNSIDTTLSSGSSSTTSSSSSTAATSTTSAGVSVTTSPTSTSKSSSAGRKDGLIGLGSNIMGLAAAGVAVALGALSLA